MFFILFYSSGVYLKIGSDRLCITVYGIEFSDMLNCVYQFINESLLLSDNIKHILNSDF